MSKVMQGLLATLLIAASTPASAIYCDYCGTSGEWRCVTGYVTVDGATYPAGTICEYFYSSGGGYSTDSYWSDYYDNLYAGGGAFRFVVKRTIGIIAENPVGATCGSDKFTRWEHANWSVRTSSLSYGGQVPAGSLVRVKYADGSSEIWQVTNPTSSIVLAEEPVPNTLKCVAQ